MDYLAMVRQIRHGIASEVPNRQRNPLTNIDENTPRPYEENEVNEESPTTPIRTFRRGLAEAQLWWRLVALSRALGGESGEETRATVDRAFRRNARVVVMLGSIYLVAQGDDGQYAPVVAPGVRTLLDALMRDPDIVRIVLSGALPLARTICRPLDRCYCCQSRSWRQHPGGDWICGVCHPLPQRQRTTSSQNDLLSS